MKKIFYIFGIVLFFIGIVVPLLHMNTADITEQENRTLAKFPEVRKKNKPNYEFGKEFESWLGDRFWGRDQLIGLKAAFEYTLEEYYTKNGVIKGKDGWMFFKMDKNSLNLTEKAIDSLEKLKKYCDNRNIKLFVVLTPRSQDIYSEYYPIQYDEKLDKKTESFLRETNINIINPIQSLKNAKKFKTYFKKDHHWTDYGALITYQEFERKFKKIYPDYQILKEDDFNISFVDQQDYKRKGVSINSFCKKIALPDFLCTSEKYPYYQYKKEIQHEVITGDWKWGVDKYINNKGYSTRGLMLGRSMCSAFNVFLTAGIKEVITVNMNNLYTHNKLPHFKSYKELVDRYNPEILVLTIREDKLKEFMEGM